MPLCVVLGCFNRHKDGKRMLRFPLGKSDGDRLRAWLEIVDRQDFQPTASSKICEDHFDDSQFEIGRADGRRLLKWNAVPTIPAQGNMHKKARRKIRRSQETGHHSVADTDSAVAGPSRRCEEGVPVQGSSCDIEFLPDEPAPVCPADTQTDYCPQLMPAELVVETTGLLYEQEVDFPEAMPEGQVLTLPMTDADTSAFAHEPDVQGNTSSGMHDDTASTGDSTPRQVLRDILNTTVPLEKSFQGEACSGSQCVHQATIAELRRKLDLQQKKITKLEKQLETVLSNKQWHLAPDQAVSAKKKDARGNRWSDATVQKALQMRLACGSRGYDFLREEALPLPSERTLQRRIEDIKFEPGILEELLPALKAKLDTMRPEEKHCALLLDEMQLTAGLDFDPTVKKPIGLATAPLANPDPDKKFTYATHGLVVMLTGLSSRWKQVVAYHFTGDSTDGAFLKEFIFSVIEKCEGAGCHIDAVISDMGSCNKALWKILGISAGRYSRPSVSCRHPCAAGTDRQLHFLADAPHVLKNIRGHLVRGQSFFLSSDTVAKYHLPSNQVSVHHIKALVKEDAKRDLKLAPHLKPSHLEDNHFDKMNVSSAVAVLNHSVGAAMRVLVHLGLLLEEAITTAWFVEQVFKWFTLMTSRYIGTAMSNFKESSHDEAVAFLEEFMVMFSSLSIKATSTDRDFFKPVQTGVLISTTSALRIQHELLNKYNFLFVLLCRLTQDALENLFSCVRSKNPVPRALEFKLTLRLIMVSQFFRPSKKGSYAVDDRTQLLEFVELKKAACEEDAEASNLLDGCLLEDEATALDDVKMQSLVYLAGYITHSVTKKFKLCNTCKEYLQADKVDENDHLLALKSYRAQADPNPLVRPSRHVVKLLQHADNVFCTYESQILTTPLSALVNTSLRSHTLPGNFPQCHDLDKRLTSAFLMLRLRIALRKLSSKAKAAKAKCGSKSVGMRAALSQIR